MYFNITATVVVFSSCILLFVWYVIDNLTLINGHSFFSMGLWIFMCDGHLRMLAPWGVRDAFDGARHLPEMSHCPSGSCSWVSCCIFSVPSSSTGERLIIDKNVCFVNNENIDLLINMAYMQIGD